MAVFSLGERRVAFRGDEWYIADNASVVGEVSVGHQASIWFNAVVRGDSETITIGDRCNIQDGSVLHADPGFPLSLGSNVSVGHQAMLHGCRVGEGSLVGINSVLLNGCAIGAGSIVAANSLVPEGKAFPDGVLLLGTPAKIVRELTGAEKADLLRMAEEYVQRARRYREQLQLQPAGLQGLKASTASIIRE
ncbi:MAG: gamma carbonic anhydrase family protein [Betaproteobacteria bacterium]|nr:gamma carbonic anhydrase family protein [Betaproteobacteria bacterium]